MKVKVCIAESECHWPQGITIAAYREPGLPIPCGLHVCTAGPFLLLLQQSTNSGVRAYSGNWYLTGMETATYFAVISIQHWSFDIWMSSERYTRELATATSDEAHGQTFQFEGWSRRCCKSDRSGALMHPRLIARHRPPCHSARWSDPNLCIISHYAHS